MNDLMGHPRILYMYMAFTKVQRYKDTKIQRYKDIQIYYYFFVIIYTSNIQYHI